MKKLALLQLLLLPLAGLAEAPRSADPAAIRCEEPNALVRVWDSCEHGVKDVAKRLSHFSNAQRDVDRESR